jgi:hypothetical protein
MDTLANDARNRRFELLAMPHLDAAFNLARWLTGNTADAEAGVCDREKPEAGSIAGTTASSGPASGHVSWE